MLIRLERRYCHEECDERNSTEFMPQADQILK